jgi:type I site-specific restriction-modification system R (restriction) subunit
MIHGDAEEREQYGVDSNRIQRLLADAKLGDARCERLENMFSLEPLTLQSIDSDEALVMRCGVMMTKNQVKQYEAKFDSLDTTHSGEIGVDEIESLLRGMGLNPPREFVEAKVAEIDKDGTGDISVDEFCALMAKCSDLEGTMEKELEALQERQRLEEERKRKEKEAHELTLNLKDKLKAHEDAMKVEFSKLIKTDRKVKDLEDLQKDMASQVKKMCDSQQRNEALWQGLSQGLKDTHRTVTQEGEGEMLPSAARLRSTLPSITPPPPPQRPASSTGFSQPPRSAR